MEKRKNIRRSTFIARPLYLPVATVALLLWISAAFCPLSATAQQADDIIKVNVSKKKMAVNENLTVEISTSETIEEFAGPAFENFILLSGPNTMRSMVGNYVNGKGKMEQKTTISYLVQPTKEGTLYIEPAMIKSKGRKYQSQKIAIEVGKAIEGQGGASLAQSNPMAAAKENIHLVSEVSNRNPYIGEPITIAYKIYFRMNIGKAMVSQMPKFNSFWTQVYTENDMPENTSDNREYYKDELYNVVTYYKVLLIPQKEGKFTINPLSINMLAEVGTGQYDYWGDEITRTTQLTVSSPAETITVRPLPRQGRPADFSGAVGQFTMNASLSKPEVNTGESSTLSIDIKGTGNISQIKLPEPEMPSEIERYDPNVQSSSSLTPTTLKGYQSEQFILIPRVKGTYAIPKIEFSYFDPGTGKYVTLSSAEMTLKATGEGAIQTPGQPSAPTAVTEKTDVNYLSNDIGFIRLTSKLEPSGKKAFYEKGWFSFLLILPIILTPAVLARRIYISSADRNSPLAKAKRAAAIARKRLGRAKKALDKGDYQSFYREMETALYSFILDKLKINRADASIERIREKLLSLGAQDETADGLINALESSNMARYAGVDPAKAENDYKAAAKAIENVNKSIKG